MTLQVKDFSSIRICSQDVAKSRDWYKQLLGIDPIKDTRNFVSFRVSTVCLDITLADAKSPSSPGGSVGYWLVNDLEQAIDKVTALGGEVYRGPLQVPEIQRTIVQIKDPIGNIIGFEAEF